MTPRERIVDAARMIERAAEWTDVGLIDGRIIEAVHLLASALDEMALLKGNRRILQLHAMSMDFVPIPETGLSITQAQSEEDFADVDNLPF